MIKYEHEAPYKVMKAMKKTAKPLYHFYLNK